MPPHPAMSKLAFQPAFPGLGFAPPSPPSPSCNDRSDLVALLPGCTVLTAGAAKPVNGSRHPHILADSADGEDTTSRSCRRSFPIPRLALAAKTSVHLPDESPTSCEADFLSRVQGPSGVTSPARLRRRMLSPPVVLRRPRGPLRGFNRVVPLRSRSDFSRPRSLAVTLPLSSRHSPPKLPIVTDRHLVMESHSTMSGGATPTINSIHE